MVLQDLGDLAGARAAYERAWPSDEKAPTARTIPTWPSRVNNLGMCCRPWATWPGRGRPSSGPWRIDERAYGPDHPNVASDVNNLGSVLQALGDLAGARAAYERALRIDERAYGPDHPDVATRRQQPGECAAGPGRPGRGAGGVRAGPAPSTSGPTAPTIPNVATGVNNLGLVLQALGDLAGARAAFERALAIFVKFLPADHPNIRIVRDNLDSLP